MENERTVPGIDEYIERKAAIESIMSEPSDAHYPSWYADKIKPIPAADVECGGRLRGVTYEDGKVTAVHIRDTDDAVKVFAPVRHGRWLSWDELHGGSTRAKNVLGVFCSECIRQSDSKTHFCPNCGCKMDLEDSECDT